MYLARYRISHVLDFPPPPTDLPLLLFPFPIPLPHPLPMRSPIAALVNPLDPISPAPTVS